MKSLEELRALREKMKSQTDNRSVATGDETVIKVVEVYKDGQKYTYVHMTPEKARKVMVEHVVNGNACKEFLVGENS